MVEKQARCLDLSVGARLSSEERKEPFLPTMLDRLVASGIVQFHLPPCRWRGDTARGAAFGGVINLDPGGGLRIVDVDPTGTVGAGFQLCRQFRQEL